MTSIAARLTVAVALFIAGNSSVVLAQSNQHELIRSDMPPGVASSYAQVNNRSLVGYTQPVQLITPPDCTIEIGDQAGFGQPTAGSVSVGLQAGIVYRFKISNLPIDGKQGLTLYPSVELLNRLYPPAELKNEFPVQVVLTREDMIKALNGQLVTRVVYLENPRNDMPYVYRPGQQPSLDVGGAIDPLREAEQLGRPMAILRLGSRVPVEGEAFTFGAPSPEVLPLPAKFITAQHEASQLGETHHAADAATASMPAPVVRSDIRIAVANQSMDRENHIRPASHQDVIPLNDETLFVPRNDASGQTAIYPLEVGTIERAHAQSGYRSLAFGRDRVDPAVLCQEYIFDGDDREARTQVDSSWNVQGLDVEDTVGHFDTMDGRRIVTPSNRVAIYAPRFAAVRKVHGVVNAQRNQTLGAVDLRTQTVLADHTGKMSSTKSNLALDRYKGSRRASGLKERTRGVLSDNVTTLFGTRNALEAFNSNNVTWLDKVHGNFGAVLQQGIQAAVAWEVDLGLQVFAKGVQPIIVKDVRTVQEVVAIESEDGTAILRVVKAASRASAKVGEEVEFQIRFDNISSQRIGNVTIMDNLTRRLEYIEGSEECSLEATFEHETNEVGSLMLRWEIKEPLEPSTGGVITFRCRAR